MCQNVKRVIFSDEELRLIHLFLKDLFDDVSEMSFDNEVESDSQEYVLEVLGGVLKKISDYGIPPVYPF